MADAADSKLADTSHTKAGSAASHKRPRRLSIEVNLIGCARAASAVRCFHIARGCFPFACTLQSVQEFCPWFPVPGKMQKSHAPMLTTPYSQKVAALPMTRVSVKNDTATIRLGAPIGCCPDAHGPTADTQRVNLRKYQPEKPVPVPQRMIRRTP